MKGTTFQKPLELKLDVAGERWRQGDTVQGTLTVKNHGPQPVSLEGLRVALATGNLTKVRAKSPAAFQTIAEYPIDATPLESGQERSAAWKVALDPNFPITDTVASPFVLYGSGHLQLNVEPAEIIDEFVKILEVSFRFPFKSRKFGKKGLEVKLTPPSSRSFATLELLVLHLRQAGTALEVDYDFQVKKVEATAASVDVSKAKRTFSQTFSAVDCRVPSGRVNFERIEAMIREVVSQVEAKIAF